MANEGLCGIANLKNAIYMSLKQEFLISKYNLNICNIKTKQKLKERGNIIWNKSSNPNSQIGYQSFILIVFFILHPHRFLLPCYRYFLSSSIPSSSSFHPQLTLSSSSSFSSNFSNFHLLLNSKVSQYTVSSNRCASRRRDVCCWCDLDSPLTTAWTTKNPRRRFNGCGLHKVNLRLYQMILCA